MAERHEFKSRFDDLTSRRFLDARKRFKLAKILHVWRIFSLQCVLMKKTVHNMILKLRRIILRRNFSFWKTIIELQRYENKENSSQLRKLKYHEASNKKKLLRMVIIEWKVLAKSSLRHSVLLQITQQRKQRRRLWACFVGFITNAQESVLRRKLLTRMSMIWFQRLLSLRFSHWKAVIYRDKIEDALCLGHDAMRKTKVDMAKRLYSRARRARLNGAMLKWKAETQNDRTMEEHANAVEAMSNWAARIAGGRILKERFQKWISYTYRMLWEKVNDGCH